MAQKRKEAVGFELDPDDDDDAADPDPAVDIGRIHDYNVLIQNADVELGFCMQDLRADFLRRNMVVNWFTVQASIICV